MPLWSLRKDAQNSKQKIVLEVSRAGEKTVTILKGYSRTDGIQNKY